MFNFLKKKEKSPEVIKENNEIVIKSFNDMVSMFQNFISTSSYNLNLNKMLRQMPENPFISAALDRIQQGFYAVEWSVYAESEKGEKKETKDNKVYSSIKQPNKIMDTNDYMYFCNLYWTIFGEFLIQKVKLYDKYDLWVYAPGEYKINYDSNNLLAGIKSIEINNKLITGKELDNFCYKRMPNLYSKTTGLNRVISLALLHDYYCLISRWNNGILANTGKRQFLILMDMLGTGNTKEKIKDQIAESNGADNVGDPLILTGFEKDNTIIQTLDFAPRDFDYMTAMLEIRNITSNVLNVPDLLIGGKDNAKYNNMKEAKEALYTENIIPACSQIKAAQNRLFSNDLTNRRQVDYDTSNIEVLKDKQIDYINALNTSEFHKVNEKRKLMGMDDVDGGDVILIKGMPSTLEDVVSGEVEPVDDDPSTEDVV